MTIQWNKITSEDWEKLPAPQPSQKPSPWDPILDELAQGAVVSIHIENAQQLRGYRIGITRRAASHNMKLEFRSTGDTLVVRKSAEPYVPKPKAEAGEGQPRRRGRPRKTEEPEA